MDDAVLREQIAYYRARAEEYDESLYQVGRFASVPSNAPLDREFVAAMNTLRGVGPVGDALELACGTGIWTRELAAISQSVTALDAAPEMLDLNRRKLADPRVQYQCVDLFAWAPERTYDLVFFAFWLSHVPPARLDAFLDTVRRAVRPGGRLFFVDEPAGTPNAIPATGPDPYQQRPLLDGREFTIVKAYYDPAQLQATLADLGFTDLVVNRGAYFYSLTGIGAG